MSGASRLGITAGSFQTAIEIEENSRTGITQRRDFEGSYAECFAVRSAWRTAGPTQIVMRSKGDGAWQISGFFSIDELGNTMSPSPNVHELEVDVAQVSWTYNQVLIALLGGDATAIPKIAKIARIVQDYQGGVVTNAATGDLADQQSKAETAATAVDATYGLKMFKNIAYRGNDTFIEYRNVYRRTLTAATNQDSVASFTGCGKIWTTGEVTTFENLPTNGLFQLEAGQLWLKSKPHCVAIANQKSQINYSYTGALTWSALLYTKYNAATLLDA